MPELYSYIAIALIAGALGFLIGGFVGIGSEKARIKNMERAARRIVDYYKLAGPEKLVPFPPGVLNNLYPSPENIKERLEKPPFTDRMKAAKAAKRKA